MSKDPGPRDRLAVSRPHSCFDLVHVEKRVEKNMKKVFGSVISMSIFSLTIALTASGNALAAPIYLHCGPGLLNYQLTLNYDTQTVVMADQEGHNWKAQIQISENVITWKDMQTSYVLDRYSLKLRYKMHRTGSDGEVNCIKTQPSHRKN